MDEVIGIQAARALLRENAQRGRCLYIQRGRRDARMNPLWTPSPAQRSNASGVRCIAKPSQEEPDPEPGLRSSRDIYARLTL